MSKLLRHVKTLLYFDGPELFIGQDQVGTRYLCHLYLQSNIEERYVCAAVSTTTLSRFLNGKLSLKQILGNPETGELYFAVLDNNEAEEMCLKQLSADERYELSLPEEYYQLDKELEGSDRGLIDEADERGHGIVHLSLSPPESALEPKICASRLADALEVFQELVKQSYKKSISKKKVADEVSAVPDNYEMEVFAFSKGSFKIHMQSIKEADLGGYVENFRAMEKLDDLTKTTEYLDPEIILSILQDNKGHLVTKYRKFIEFVLDNDTPLTYEWALPYSGKSKKRTISYEGAKAVYEVLRSRSELQTEIKSFIGTMSKADVPKGYWAFESEEDGKTYSGRIAKNSGISLSGITLTEKKYKFIFEERLEIEVVTGKEKPQLWLIHYEPV